MNSPQPNRLVRLTSVDTINIYQNHANKISLNKQTMTLQQNLIFWTMIVLASFLKESKWDPNRIICALKHSCVHSDTHGLCIYDKCMVRAQESRSWVRVVLSHFGQSAHLCSMTQNVCILDFFIYFLIHTHPNHFKLKIKLTHTLINMINYGCQYNQKIAGWTK